MKTSAYYSAELRPVIVSCMNADRQQNETPRTVDLGRVHDLAAFGGMAVTDGKRLGRLWEYNPITGFCVIRHLSVAGMEWTAQASDVRPVIA